MYFSQKYLNNLNPNEIIKDVKKKFNVVRFSIYFY